MIILDFGNLFFFWEGDCKFQGGVGFFVCKFFVNNVCEVDSVLNRVVYFIFRIFNWYLLKVIQVYVLILIYCDDEVEVLYEEILKVIYFFEIYFIVVMGDFNVKVGIWNSDELRIGLFGYGQ